MQIDLLKKEWIVTGIISDEATDLPLEGFAVQAWDLDFLFCDDCLGKDVTDTEGRFTIKFRWEQFRDIFEFSPDVYLKIFDAHGHLLKDTSGEVVRNIGHYREFFIKIPSQTPRRSIDVGGILVNPKVFEALRAQDIVDFVKHIRGIENKEVVATFEQLSPELSTKSIYKNFCLNDLFTFIEEALRIKKADRRYWLEIEAVLRPDSLAYSTHTYDTPNFSITYVLNDGGANSPGAVNPTDSAVNILQPGTATVLGTTTAGNGVPNYVEKVGFWLERALNRYINPPFSLRNPAAGGRIAVNIINLGGPGGFANPSGFTIHNANNDDLIAAISSHELFHMVQYQYSLSTTVSQQWNRGMAEGGAVLAEDSLFDNHNRYIVQATSTGTLPNPNISLHDASRRYEFALFLKYLCEQQSSRVGLADEPSIGIEAYTALITSCDSSGYLTTSLRDAIHQLPFYQTFYEFFYIDPARLDLSTNESLLANFYLALYMKDLGVNIPDRRFDFMEDEENSTWDQIFLGAVTVGSLGSVNIASTHPLPDGGVVNITNSVNTFSARYHIINPVAAVETLRINFTAGSGFTRPIFQILQINADGSVRDIHRSDANNYSKTIANQQGGQNLDRIVVVVIGTDTGGNYTIGINEVANAPDVMITRWNSAVGKEYHVDSFNWSWTWGSPDVWVDNDNNGVGDSVVYFDYDNKLYIRLRNKGRATANGVSVAFWYQDASGSLSDAGWQPVRNLANVVQSLSSINIPAGGSYSDFVSWSPDPSGSSQHFCVRVVVISPGDPNTDNKRCTNNFGNVRVGSPYFDLFIRRTNLSELAATIERIIIPRFHKQMEISGFDAMREQIIELAPNGIHLDQLRVYQRPTKIDKDRTPIFIPACPEPKLAMRRPDISSHYDPHPDILPPGLEGTPMVTVVHLKDGVAVGGYTYAIHLEEKELEE